MTAIRPAIRPALRPAIRSVFGGSAAVWTPLTLFANSEVGVWYDPSDLTTMFQDSAGTTPVTADGQTVGLILDKSKGLVLGSEVNPDPSFDNPASWIAQAGWVVSGGSATFTPGTASFVYASTTPSPSIAGKRCKITITVTQGTAVLLSSQYIEQASLGVGTHVVYVTPKANLAPIYASSLTTVTSFSVKELAGNHAYQSTAASRPILGRTPATGQRNLLTYTEQFDNAVWTTVQGVSSVSANAVTAPDGSLTADKIIPAATTLVHGKRYLTTFAGLVPHTFSFYVKAAEAGIKVEPWAYISHGGVVDLSTGVVEDASAATFVVSAVDAYGFRRVSMTFTPDSTPQNMDIRLTRASTRGQQFVGDGTSGIYIWGAQLEVGSSATAYQKVTAAYDVTEAGVADCYNLYFDGSDDFLVTSAIDFSATDEMSVFFGAYKANDTAGIVVELSSAATNAGTFFAVVNDGTKDWSGTARGSANAAPGQAAGITEAGAATAVITNTHDISADLTTIRKNGVAGTDATADKGTGNFGAAYPLYIGRRGGTLSPFNGYIYSLIVRNKVSSAAEITSTEAYIAALSGVTL